MALITEFDTKKLLLASACAATITLSMSTIAQSADLDDPGFDWTGFYAGAHLGYGWGEARWTTVGGNRRTHNVDGILGGIQAGYNFQMDSIVFGLEGDFSGTGIDGGTSWIAGAPLAAFPRNASLDINWLATIAGRVGMTMDRTLFYAKGGLALAGVDYRHLSANGVRKGDATRTGWLIGAGVEHAFNDAWSAKIEYNYMDFGSKGITMKVTGFPDRVLPVKQHVNVIKVGVNYHF